jgi:class 3 adenylate cyclase
VEAERRQVTVLFTDMVGFTTFSERAGEEAAYMLMRRLSELMDEAVCEQGGVVQSFTGDGIMAVFGAPVSFEDAPLRARRAALSILLRIKAASDELEVKHGLRPQVRIGLNIGTAVVGKVQRGTAGVTVLGDTVNVAARLQALAEPDSVLVSDATNRSIPWRFSIAPGQDPRRRPGPKARASSLHRHSMLTTKRRSLSAEKSYFTPSVSCLYAINPRSAPQ